MPFGSLSREDQQYIRALLTARGEGHTCPPAENDNPEFMPMGFVAPEPSPVEFPDVAPDLTGPRIAGKTPLHEQTRNRPPVEVEVPWDAPPDGEPLAEKKAPSNRDVVAIQPATETHVAGSKRTLKLPEPAQIMAMAIALPFQAGIGSLIGALILRASTSLVFGEKLPYGQAYFTIVLTTLATGCLSILGLSLARAADSDLTILVAITGTGIVSLIVQIAIVAKMLDTTFGAAILVVLAMCFVSMMVVLAIFAIVFVLVLLLFGTGLALHR